MILRVAVIGSGVMGSGIAAQIANNDLSVLLYDLENENGLIAEQSIQKQINAVPSGFTHPLKAYGVKALSLTKDLEKIKNCHLVIEAITEKLDVKKDLYNKLSEYLAPDAIIASNTSTFRLSDLKSGLSESLQNRLTICHFFNPPRFMRLLEFVPGSISDEKKYDMIVFLKYMMGKDVIVCNDTPGFIANRLGCYLMWLVYLKAKEENFKIEEIDYAFTKYFGFPSTGIFGLFDLIGLDVMDYIATSLTANLDSKDDFCKIFKHDKLYQSHLSSGYNGRKGKGGFYKLEKNQDGTKSKFSLDLDSYNFREYKECNLAFKDGAEFLASNTKLSIFIKNILDRFFEYTEKNSESIASNIYDIDKAMKLGFAWKYGPFQLMQKYSANGKDMEFDEERFEINPKKLRGEKLLTSNGVCNIWKIKEGKICFEIKTKMHVLNADVFDGIFEACRISEKENSDLIIYSDDPNFSAGADLKKFYEIAQAKDADALEEQLHTGQIAMLRLKYMDNIVISCAKGVALGGGCELLLYSDAVIAHQDLQAGLVESSIGLIPGWGGLTEMILRSPETALDLILKGYKSSSAYDFYINYKNKVVRSLPSNNNILDYAIVNDFKKIRSKVVTVSKSKIKFPPGISNDITEKLKSYINEVDNKKLDLGDLLKLERKIFSELLFLEKTQEMIKKFV